MITAMEHRFEPQYPLNAREKEIKEILRFVTRLQSCQIISPPGAGRSTVLRLLAYHPQLLEHHLKNSNGAMKQSNNLLFIYVNFAEIPTLETAELMKALFLAILASIRERGQNVQPWTSIGKEIYTLFKEALSLNDSLIFSQYLKKAVQQLSNNNNVTIVLLFDRFSEFTKNLPSDFFSTLRSLRAASSNKLAVVFSTHRPLEELLSPQPIRDFYEFFAGNNINLALYDKPASDFRVGILEKEYGKKLNSYIKEELIRLTGGHGRLMKLSTQIILNEGKPPQKTNLLNLLLSHILIRGSLLEIWSSLTPEERQNPFFPLFDEFVKRGLPQALVPKTIRFNQQTNEIYFGDQPLSGLTAYEFKLLSFLIGNPNRVCERQEIIEAVWSDSKTQAGVTDEALDQMIFRLRRKIEDEADNPKHLLTIKGRGFKFLP